MKKLLITGAGGMLAKDAAEIFTQAGYQVTAAKKSDLDVSDEKSVEEFFAKNTFDFVLHAAAYTKVDDAETNQDLAFLINTQGAKNLAKATKQQDIPIIYISTDYVFNGEKGSPYLPSDTTAPINVYGASKLAGEEFVRSINPKHYIARTSWLFGLGGKNFVDTMLQMAQKQKEIRVVNDQFGCPTWTYDLAKALKNLIEEKRSFGTYHLCNSNFTTWFGLAKKIFEIRSLAVEVVPVATAEFPRPAKRPGFSAMDNAGALQSWEEALKQYLKI
jgi:dTDP-4-dehydrorhamnose reductase